jgi:hypothetical protein
VVRTILSGGTPGAIGYVGVHPSLEEGFVPRENESATKEPRLIPGASLQEGEWSPDVKRDLALDELVIGYFILCPVFLFSFLFSYCHDLIGKASQR